MYDYLVVGAGLFGAVFAHEAKKNGKSVLVIDKRPNIIPFAPYLETRNVRENPIVNPFEHSLIKLRGDKKINIPDMEHTYFIRMILECGII